MSNDMIDRNLEKLRLLANKLEEMGKTEIRYCISYDSEYKDNVSYFSNKIDDITLIWNEIDLVLQTLQNELGYQNKIYVEVCSNIIQLLNNAVVKILNSIALHYQPYDYGFKRPERIDGYNLMGFNRRARNIVKGTKRFPVYDSVRQSINENLKVMDSNSSSGPSLKDVFLMFIVIILILLIIGFFVSILP